MPVNDNQHKMNQIDSQHNKLGRVFGKKHDCDTDSIDPQKDECVQNQSEATLRLQTAVGNRVSFGFGRKQFEGHCEQDERDDQNKHCGYKVSN
jgi:hypothetical protein